MNAIESLVPGFHRSLQSLPGAEVAWKSLGETLDRERFLPRAATALVGVVAAHRVGGDYARWAMGRAAAGAGASAESILLASCGGARNATEAALVRAAWTMLSAPDPGKVLDCPARFAALLGERGTAELVARVAMAVLECRTVELAAPAAAATARGA